MPDSSLPSAASDESFFVIPVDSAQRAVEWRAVLDSQEIENELHTEDGHLFFIIYNDTDFAEAVRNIEEYEKERPFFDKLRAAFKTTAPPTRLSSAYPSLLFSLFLFLFHYYRVMSSKSEVISDSGMLSALFFKNNEWWRSVTALTLHAGFPHLAGNIIFFLLFAVPLSGEAGGGTALLFAFCAGVLGNLTTLYIFGREVYNAIGFSTSVFGVLGILTALRLMKNIKVKHPSSLYFWIPLLASGAIFGLTGGGAGSDLSGHLFGFLWGVILGIPVHFLSTFSKNKIIQYGSSITVFAFLAICWYYALKTT